MKCTILAVVAPNHRPSRAKGSKLEPICFVDLQIFLIRMYTLTLAEDHQPAEPFRNLTPTNINEGQKGVYILGL